MAEWIADVASRLEAVTTEEMFRLLACAEALERLVALNNDEGLWDEEKWDEQDAAWERARAALEP